MKTKIQKSQLKIVSVKGQNSKSRKTPLKIPIYHKKTVENFTCFYCERKFKSLDTVKWHVNTTKTCNTLHNIRKKEQPGAKTCKEEQERIDNLTIKCKKCGMGQPTKGALKSHVFRNHGGGKHKNNSSYFWQIITESNFIH